jgi:hypothetical protein
MALKPDFEAVGDDIRYAVEGFSRKNVGKASE